MLRLFASILCIFMPVFAWANTIPGQDAPKFQAAIDLWLDGDDTAALTVFSELARDDNTAAQIFLGQLEPLLHLHTHVTGSLSRADRIALLRQPEGLSGKSWLERAQNDSALAAALLKSRRVGEKADAIGTLLEFNEQQSALLPLISIGNQGNLETLAKLHENPAVTGAAKAYIESVLGAPQSIGTTSKTKQPEQSSDRILLQSIPLPSQTGSNIVATALAEQMALRPEYSPIQKLCEASCVNRNRCMVGVIATLSGEPSWIKLASPVETLLSTERYHKSPRIRDDLKRRVTMQPLYKSGWLQNYDQCTYQALQTP
ncbi:hypothetical protein [Parasulfitobacter algicola]|uniref:Uncharacterized protein n=1 Tax=Parasulfitobacter algicola TaxID=2614809 RepID=A0ABX2ITZ8_9RHOB|nr:hypothetical protein [Sulfitobacter algicola]NSX56384.1 hypothetical protein [Sulfitobacter algicola]